MLESLYIKNYRLFQELKINSLRVIKLILTKKQMIKAVELDIEDIEAALEQGFEIR